MIACIPSMGQALFCYCFLSLAIIVWVIDWKRKHWPNRDGGS